DYSTLNMLELILAGFSAEHQKMRLWFYSGTNRFEPVNGDHMQGLHPFPYLPPRLAPKLGKLKGDDRLVGMVKGIGAAFRDPTLNMGGVAVGGEVIAYEITPEGM